MTGRRPRVDGVARRPTVSDVAARAGVSTSTVSKALNDRGQLRADTRDRVRRAADELAFEPNVLARGLLTGRSYTVGVITTDSFGRFSIPVMLGLEDTLDAGQLSVLLCDGRGDPAREQHYLRTLLRRRVDGIVVTGRRSEPRPALGSAVPVPVVYVLGPSAAAGDISVVVDDVQGGRLAVEHLLLTGRDRIAHLTGPEHHLSARQRARGAAEALAAAGAPAPEVHWGTWSEAWGREGVQRLRDAGTGFDAIFCGSDQIARGALDALREAGVGVPTEVAVIGFDNWEVMAAAARPALSTVDPGLTSLGHQAATRMLAAIDGRPDPGVHRATCRLVVRDSTAAVHPSDEDHTPPAVRVDGA